MAKLLKIDVFTDVVCPWCLVGSARLDAALANLPDDVDVIVGEYVAEAFCNLSEFEH